MLARLDPATKVDPDWPLLLQLRDLGRAAAGAWLDPDRARPAQRPPLARPQRGPSLPRTAASGT